MEELQLFKQLNLITLGPHTDHINPLTQSSKWDALNMITINDWKNQTWLTVFHIYFEGTNWTSSRLHHHDRHHDPLALRRCHCHRRLGRGGEQGPSQRARSDFPQTDLRMGYEPEILKNSATDSGICKCWVFIILRQWYITFRTVVGNYFRSRATCLLLSRWPN